MTTETRAGRPRILATAVVGLLLAIMPLPGIIEPLRPDWLLIIVVYWSLTAPRLTGLSIAWICGITMDVLKGTVLGQHALAFLVVAFLTHRLQLRMRVFPIWHQALTVFMLLAVYEFLVFWIDGITGQAVLTWLRWLPVLTGALLWPFVVSVLDTLNRRLR